MADLFTSAEPAAPLAEMLRRFKGGAAVVMGALSPATRNAQVAMFQRGEVDYLVATDAIGMGLNMDVTHVAFAGLEKFDGRRDRRLTIPEMAQIAVKYATTAILTSDNPRHEDPDAILDDMVAGLAPGDRYLRIADRAEAIRTAAMLAKPGDILLLAGKGHETYQIVGDVKNHFDDKEEALRAFALYAKN